MQTVSTIGLDIAKSVFQVHGVDGAGRVVKTALRFCSLSRDAFSMKFAIVFLATLSPRQFETPGDWQHIPAAGNTASLLKILCPKR
jgi:hypothetical protein